MCIVRTQLTISAADLSVTTMLPEVIRRFIHVKANDIVTVVIYVVVPLLCGRSIVGQYGYLRMNSLRQLFFDAFFTPEVNLLKPVPILTILLTSASCGYLVRLVTFIYSEWTYSLNPLFQTLQFYPSLLLTFQTLYQGIFLLQAFGNRKFLRTIVDDHDVCCRQLQHHVLLNFTLLLHCVSILAVVGFKYVDQDDLIVDLAMGEVAYRLFALGTFCCLIAKVQKEKGKSAETSTEGIDDTYSIDGFTSPIEETRQCDPSTAELVPLVKVTAPYMHMTAVHP